jgi:prepilin-type N-terminal cleavage/methylation domain-containing protein
VREECFDFCIRDEGKYFSNKDKAMRRQNFFSRMTAHTWLAARRPGTHAQHGSAETSAPNPQSAIPNPHSAFTLVELLVVIAIIGVLVALLLPAIQAAREAARRVQCQNQMRQIGIALQNYHDVKKQLPAGGFWDHKNYPATPAIHSGWDWLPKIFPYIELSGLHSQLDFELGPGDQTKVPKNLDTIKTEVPGLLCPSNPFRGEATDNEGFAGTKNPRLQVGEADYAANVGDYRNQSGTGDGLDHTQDNDGDGFPDWPFEGNVWVPSYKPKFPTRGVINRFGWAAKFKEIPDGLSNTFAVGECIGAWCLSQNLWTQSWSTTAQPINHKNPYYSAGSQNVPTVDNPQWSDSIAFRSLHPGGAQFIMCDASVHFLSENIDHASYRAMASREGADLIAEGVN